MTYAPIPNEDVDVSSPLTTALMTQLRDNAEYARVGYVSVSGASQDLDLEAGQFFDAGTLTADTTVSFSNVPTEARWSYTAGVEFSSVYALSSGFFLKEASVVGQESDPRDVEFKPDGTIMYIIGTSSDTIYQYTLSTAWDVSTASYSSKSFSVSSQEPTPLGCSFKADGTSVYVVGVNRIVYQYTLSTAWDISTASYSSKSFSVSSQETNPQDVTFKPDGTEMFILGASSDTAYKYSLSTAWDVSTASYTSESLSLSPLTSPSGITFGEGGGRLFATCVDRNTVGEFSTGELYTTTFPSSVSGLFTELTSSKRVAYTFFTADGGTTVNLIGEEIT